MKIRSYIKGDEKEIMDLDARELPTQWNPRTLENWHWKFTERNPAGHSFIWVAEHGGHLVGHFAAVPYRLKIFDEVVTASHTIGALVDKKYRNRGLLKFVGEKLMEELVKNNIPYTWGFPNRLAHKFENVILKYNDLVDFSLWKVEKAALKKTPPNPGIRAVMEFDEAFNKLWERCSPGYEIAVVRNKIYLDWRYLQRPDWKYYPFAFYENDELKGYVVLKLYREENTQRGHIIDIFAQRDDAQTLAALIDHSINFFIEQAVDEITVLIWGSSLIETLFTDRGFFKAPFDRPLILRINLDHKYKDKMRDNSHWYFTMGDSTEIF
jgi:GNAT superfamily N-acetyltransferase